MIFIHRSSMCPSNYSRFNVIIDYVIILVCAQQAWPPVVNHWNRVNKSKIWINHRLIVLKSLGIDCGSRKLSNSDVSVGFWNGFTSLTSTLNTAWNAWTFFSAWDLIIRRTFCSRTMTWDLQTSKKLNSDVKIRYPTF